MGNKFLRTLLFGASGIIAMWIGEVSAQQIEYRTAATFENPDGTDTSGVGTSQFSYGAGQPSVLTFTGVTEPGRLPLGTNIVIGDISLFNGVINSGTGSSVVDLNVIGQECDSSFPSPACVPPPSPITGGGIAQIDLVNTANGSIPGGVPDSWCVNTANNLPLCAWVNENDMATFTVIAALGSIDIIDVIPLNDGGFLTVGTDPNVDPIFPVQIDIKPGDSGNRVPINFGVSVTVAIFTTSESPNFDATQIDPETVTFGTTGSETHAWHSKVRDVDEDGNDDLTLRFNIKLSGLTCASTRAFLKGDTFVGPSFVASATIAPVNCGEGKGE